LSVLLGRSQNLFDYLLDARESNVFALFSQRWKFLSGLHLFEESLEVVVVKLARSDGIGSRDHDNNLSGLRQRVIEIGFRVGRFIRPPPLVKTFHPGTHHLSLGTEE
jgi:hypothetical protein